MQITFEFPDDELDSAIETWIENNLDNAIETYLQNNGFDGSDVEEKIRELLEGYDAAGDGCRTQRAFEETVGKVLDKRGNIKPSRDVLKDMVVTELARTFYDLETLTTRRSAAQNAEL